ncbi:MAG: hypothetical protein GY861_05235 [bacterium]|nr:hypothetical protein [bacterium]
MYQALEEEYDQLMNRTVVMTVPLSKQLARKKFKEGEKCIQRKCVGERNLSELTLKTVALIEKELKSKGKLHLGTSLVSKYVQTKCEEKVMETVAEVLKELEAIGVPEFNQLCPDLFQEVMEVVNSLLNQVDQ